ncbi:MAG: cell division protein FtsA, partial [Minisyncoccia bacterium]
ISKTNKRLNFNEAVTGIGGGYLEVKNSKGTVVISRSSQEVTEEDMEKAIQAAEAFALPLNRSLVQSVLKNFRVDGGEKIKDPSGMKGIKLEAEIILIDTFSPVIKSLEKVGEYIGLNFAYKFVLPLAGAEAVLKDKDKDLGVMTIDFGAGTTSICVYEDNELIDLKVFPLGGNHVTNDIAVGLKTYVDIAEEIKVNEGVAYNKKVGKNDFIDAQKYFQGSGERISKKFLAEIIEARLSEILDLIAEELKQIDRFCKLPAGIVIYGGGAKMPYLTDLIKDKLKLAVRFGKIEKENREENQLEFIPALGLLNFLLREEPGKIFFKESHFLGKIFKPFWKFFNI